MRFCRFGESSRRGGSTPLPQRTEPCHCVDSQPWAFHGALQGQMQPLLCAAGVVEPALGAAAGLSRRAVRGCSFAGLKRLFNLIPTLSFNERLCALPQPPVQAPPPLLHTAEAAFDLAVPCGMPRAGHSHTGRALCAVVNGCCLLLWKSPQTGKTAPPTNHLHSTPAAAPSAGPTTPAAPSTGCNLPCST